MTLLTVPVALGSALLGFVAYRAYQHEPIIPVPLGQSSTPIGQAAQAASASGAAPSMSILDAQNALNALGYGPLKTDGQNGPETQKAVKAFQAKVNITVDGIVGPQTSAALKLALAAHQGGNVSTQGFFAVGQDMGWGVDSGYDPTGGNPYGANTGDMGYTDPAMQGAMLAPDMDQAGATGWDPSTGLYGGIVPGQANQQLIDNSAQAGVDQYYQNQALAQGYDAGYDPSQMGYDPSQMGYGPPGYDPTGALSAQMQAQNAGLQQQMAMQAQQEQMMMQQMQAQMAAQAQQQAMQQQMMQQQMQQQMQAQQQALADQIRQSRLAAAQADRQNRQRAAAHQQALQQQQAVARHRAQSRANEHAPQQSGGGFWAHGY